MRVGFGQVDDVGRCEHLLLDIGVDRHDLTVPYDDARIRSAFIANAIEQPTAADNELPFLPLGPLRHHQLWREQDERDIANQVQGSFHLVTSLRLFRRPGVITAARSPRGIPSSLQSWHRHPAQSRSWQW